MADPQPTDPVVPTGSPDADSGLPVTQALNPDTATQGVAADTVKPGRPLPQIKGYEILGLLGRGGMGIVYKAKQLGLKRLVALKMISGGAAAGDEMLARFRSEAETVARLQHPNIVQVYEVGDVDGYPFFCLEFVEGGSLAHRLQGAPQPPRSAAQLIHLLAQTIHYAHQNGIIHRDLKPANILLAAGNVDVKLAAAPTANGWGVTTIPKIADFGLAKQLDDTSERTQTGSILGTPYYMAPEQASGRNKEIGPTVDVYALGAILYEMLTGRPPFRGESTLDTLEQVRNQEPVPPSRLQPKVPRDLETICLKCLQKSPDNRYGSAAALAEDLRRFLAHEPILARPVGRVERLARWCRRNPLLAFISGIAGLSFLAALVLAIVIAIEEHKAGIEIAKQEEETKKALRASERVNARMAFHTGQTFCENGQPRRGLLWMAHSLKIAPDDDLDLRRLIRMNLAAWVNQIRPLRLAKSLPGKTSFAAFNPAQTVLVTVDSPASVQLWDAVTGRPINEIRDLKGQVWRAGFDPSGQLLITWGNVEECLSIRVWDAVTLQPFLPPIKSHDGVWDVLFSADGRFIVTAAAKGKAQVWDRQTGRALGEALAHENGRGIGVIALSPDGKHVLTGGADGAAILWRTETGTVERRMNHAEAIRAVAFSPDGAAMLTASADKTVRLWHTADGKPIGAAWNHEGPIVAAAFSPNGGVVATVQNNGVVRVWDPAKGQTRGGPVRVEGAFGSMQFSRDSKVVVVASLTGTIRIIETAGGRAVGTALAHQSQASVVPVVAFTPDGLIATGGFNGCHFWDPATGQPAEEPLPHPGNVTALAVGSQGAIWTEGHNGAAYLWLPPARINRHVLRHDEAVESVAFCPHCRLVATASFDHTARLWSLATGKPQGESIRHQGRVHVVRFSPDGKTLLTGSADKTACQWDVETQKLKGAPLVHQGGLTPWTITYSSDGKKILSGDNQGAVYLWDADTCKPCCEPMRHERWINEVAFSPDGKSILSASQDGTARLWDAATGKPLARSFKHDGTVTAAVFSPDGRIIVTGGTDNTARRWDVATGKPIGEPLRHQGSVRVVAFSRDGARIATASFDETAQLWDAATGAPIGEPLRHKDRVRAVVFSPDGTRVVTVSFDKTARVWDTASGKPIGPALHHDNWVVTAAFSADGQTIATGSTDKTARLWQSPPPVCDEPERITRWTQTVTGMELDANGAIRALNGPAWHTARTRLAELGGPPQR